jgi:cytochrome b6-f complex iron-sulfur subunit
MIPQAEPTYLIVTEDGNIQNYGVNSICTHLGCVVPWVAVRTPRVAPIYASRMLESHALI